MTINSQQSKYKKPKKKSIKNLKEIKHQPNSCKTAKFCESNNVNKII